MKLGKQFDIDSHAVLDFVRVDYNPLKGMLVLISSLKFSTDTGPYAAGPESRGQHGYRCQTASQVSLFVGFLFSWISLPTNMFVNDLILNVCVKTTELFICEKIFNNLR
jgi:hypothetical protein